MSDEPRDPMLEGVSGEDPDEPPPIVEDAPGGWDGRDRRRRPLWPRILGALCVLALFGAIGGLFIRIDSLLGDLEAERLARVEADEASILERRVTACVVRGVLELSRDRALRAGALTEADSALYAAALAPLRRDCPPLIVPPERERTPPTPPAREFPRAGDTP